VLAPCGITVIVGFVARQWAWATRSASSMVATG
jgi:hypothetical protein